MANVLNEVKKNITNMLVNQLFEEVKQFAAIDSMQATILDNFKVSIGEGMFYGRGNNLTLFWSGLLYPLFCSAGGKMHPPFWKWA